MSARNAGGDDIRIELGHLVISVRSLDVSLPFYCKVFGMRKRRENPSTEESGRRMAFLTFGSNDHDLALLELGPSAPRHDGTRAGLQHIAFRIGGGIEQLRAFKVRLDALGVVPLRLREHRVSWSVYMQDPDGIELEAYVESDTPVLDPREGLGPINRPFRLD